MRFVFLICLVITITNRGTAQINVGIKLNPGFGYIKSPTLNGLVQNETAEPGVVYSNARSGIGSNAGVGGFVQYNFTPKVSILLEPTINLLNSNIFINYKRESLDLNGTGSQFRLASTSNLKLFYVNLPILARYVLLPAKKIYAIGGLSLDLVASPRITVSEKLVESKYAYHTMTSSDVTNMQSNGTLDKFSPIQGQLIAGVGKTFRRKLKNLSIDLRYSMPFTNSKLYSNSSLDGQSYNTSLYNSNETFSIADSPQQYKKPGNYKVGILAIAIRYTLFKTTKN